jgi:hypothetical protein
MADLSFAHDAGMQDEKGDNEYMDFTVSVREKSILASDCVISSETMSSLDIFCIEQKLTPLLPSTNTCSLWA